MPGVALLDSEMDAAHNRCVISIAGEPNAVARGVVDAVGKAAELIDLRQHRGEHPRMGATDVVPFIPISGMSIEDCVQLSLEVAEEIASRHKIPVYLYEQSARIPARQDLAYVRRGEFEGIRDEIRTNPERKPDFGRRSAPDCRRNRGRGALPLIAYNIYLNTPDLKIAQAIARAIRFSSGGLRYVKALGFEIKERNQVQVSMNLTNFEATPVFRVFEMVAREAERFGVSRRVERDRGPGAAKGAQCLRGFLSAAGEFQRQSDPGKPFERSPAPGRSVTEFVSGVASPEAVPGGGSVAAHAASLAAALGGDDGRIDRREEEARIRSRPGSENSMDS